MSQTGGPPTFVQLKILERQRSLSPAKSAPFTPAVPTHHRSAPSESGDAIMTDVLTGTSVPNPAAPPFTPPKAVAEHTETPGTPVRKIGAPHHSIKGLATPTVTQPLSSSAKVEQNEPGVERRRVSHAHPAPYHEAMKVPSPVVAAHVKKEGQNQMNPASSETLAKALNGGDISHDQHWLELLFGLEHLPEGRAAIRAFMDSVRVKLDRLETGASAPSPETYSVQLEIGKQKLNAKIPRSTTIGEVIEQFSMMASANPSDCSFVIRVGSTDSDA